MKVTKQGDSGRKPRTIWINVRKQKPVQTGTTTKQQAKGQQMNSPLGVHLGKLIQTPRQSTLTQTHLADQPVGDRRRVADPPSPFMLPPSIQVMLILQSDTALTQHSPHSPMHTPTHTQQTCSHNTVENVGRRTKDVFPAIMSAKII